MMFMSFADNGFRLNFTISASITAQVNLIHWGEYYFYFYEFMDQ